MYATQVVGIIEMDVPAEPVSFDNPRTGLWPAGRQNPESDHRASYAAVVANLSQLSKELRVEVDRLQQRLSDARRRQRELNQAC